MTNQIETATQDLQQDQLDTVVAGATSGLAYATLTVGGVARSTTTTVGSVYTVTFGGNLAG